MNAEFAGNSIEFCAAIVFMTDCCFRSFEKLCFYFIYKDNKREKFAISNNLTQLCLN